MKVIYCFLIAVLFAVFYAHFSAQADPIIQSTYDAETMPEKTQKEEQDYIAILLADTGNTWKEIFKTYNVAYEEPRIVVYAAETISPCGKATTKDGPFYCPANKTLYLDPEFLNKLRTARRLPGNFAVAYSIAHEVGHHVQNEWGILAELGRMPEPENADEYEIIPQKLETMADCLAGVWASQQKGKLDAVTIRAGIDTASDIEALYPAQKKDGVVVAKPRSHGDVKDRIKWFTRGYEGKTLQSCNTFWE